MTSVDHTGRALHTGDGVTDGPASAGRLPGRIVAVGLVFGLVLGALLGALVGAGRASTYQATTIVSVLPDDALTAAQLSGGGGTSQNTSDFIQGELVVLTSDGIRSAVRQRLRLPTLPTVSASQSGTTDIVDIIATADTQAEAVRIADATRSLYAARRSAQLAQDVSNAENQVRAQIATVRQQIANTPTALTDTNNALAQEYARLLAVSSQLALDSAQSARAVTTIQPATPAAGGLSKAATYALAGAVIGLLLAAAGLVAFRRLRPRVRGPQDLAGVGPDVLVPTFPARARPADRAARLLASRLRGAGSRRGGSIVLIGARPTAGTTRVALALVQAYARAGQVLLVATPGRAQTVRGQLPTGAELVTAAELGGAGSSRSRLFAVDAPDATARVLVLDASVDDLRALVAGGLFDAAGQAGWMVVADLPSLEESDLGVALAVAAGSATVVVAKSATSPTDVVGVVDALDGSGVARQSLLLHQRPPRWARSRRGGPSSAAPSPTVEIEKPALDHRAVRPSHDHRHPVVDRTQSGNVQSTAAAGETGESLVERLRSGRR